MALHIQHPSVNGDTETWIDVDVEIYDQPFTSGGLRDMADIEIVVPLGSPAQETLALISDSHKPMRLRADGHVGMWLISKESWPGIPSDDCVRLTLIFAGPAATA